MTDALAAAQGCFGAWAAAAFIAGALYATLTVGVSGGPNHGEHPFLVTLLHALAFFVFARGWARGPWWGYLGLLALTLLASVWAMGLVGAGRGKLGLGRGLIFALHAGMFAIAGFGA